MKKLIVLSVSIFVLVGCKKTTTSILNDDLIPMKTGNTWYYALSVYLNGTVVSTAQDSVIIESFGNHSVIINDTVFYNLGSAVFPDYCVNRNKNTVMGSYDGVHTFFQFQVTNTDSLFIGEDVNFYGNIDSVYGFSSTYSINGYSNCNKVVRITFSISPLLSYIPPNSLPIISKTVYYLRKGIGIIRSEEYLNNYTAGGGINYSIYVLSNLTQYKLN
jgi:hypothetical protein